MKKIYLWLHTILGPENFYRLSGRFLPWLAISSALLFAWGLYASLYLAPVDYQQGDSYRIIFVHVPAAWLSQFCYVLMAVNGFSAWVWRVKVSEIAMINAAPIGASFTFLALVTGSLWGKPMWGTYWIWDARLTSELFLLFLYIGVIGLYNAIDGSRKAARAAGMLATVGLVNLPIIHYSVEWWHTLHQGPTISKLGKPSMHIDMLIPLLVMITATVSFFFLVWLMRIRVDLLKAERKKNWIRKYLQDGTSI